MLYFLHHYDRINQGDVLSGPYHYFDFGMPYEKISWDKQIIKPAPIAAGSKDTIIMGGGIYFAKNKPRLENLLNRIDKIIGWGIGLDIRADPENFVKRFSLLGTRERQSSLIDNESVFYVPCASCMHPAFEAFVGEYSPERTKPTASKTVLHTNGGFNERELASLFEEQGIERTKTSSDFETTLSNLQNAACVVTNSYHGAYWASLMGKKVVCLKTEVPKWDGLHENIVFSTPEDVEDAISRAESIPATYLAECRSLNRDFYDRVQKRLSD